MLEIADYTGKDDAHEAGYGRNYDVVLRRFGAQLRLALNAVNSGNLDGIDVPPVKFKRVVLSVGTVEEGHSAPFTVDAEIKIGKLRNGENVLSESLAGNEDKKGVTADGKNIVGTNPEEHEYWAFSPWVEPAAKNGAVKTISTYDVENIDGVPTAFFTLLPLDDRDVSSVFNADGTANFSGVKITVETNYGKIELENNEKELIWSKDATKMTLDEGLTSFLSVAFSKYDKDFEDGLYENQLKSNRGVRGLSVDMTKLDMTGLHIETKEDLANVLKVYDEIGKNKPVTFILDGTGEDKTFAMDKTAWTAVESRLATEGNNVKFALCDREAPCEAIVLDNTGNDAVAEVPALSFETTAEDCPVKSSAVVELVGDWKLNAKREDKDAKVLGNVSELVVSENGKLSFADTYVNVKGHEDGFKIVNKGEVVATGEVFVESDIDNHGLFTIPVKAADADENRVVVDGSAVLTNMWDPDTKKADKIETWWKVTGNEVLGNCGGVIDNYGSLTIRDDSKGQINNYGTINIKNTTARTLITSNGKSDKGVDAIKYAYDPGKNMLGTINLTSADAGKEKLTIKTVNAPGAGEVAEGFVKYVATAKNNCAYANYAVVTGNEIGGDHKGKKYIEIKNDGTEIEISNDVSTTTLIIPKGKSIYIPNASGKNVTVSKYLYLKGWITKAGTLTKTGAVHKGYFGGADTDTLRICKSFAFSYLYVKR